MNETIKSDNGPQAPPRVVQTRCADARVEEKKVDGDAAEDGSRIQRRASLDISLSGAWDAVRRAAAAAMATFDEEPLSGELNSLACADEQYAHCLAKGDLHNGVELAVGLRRVAAEEGSVLLTALSVEDGAWTTGAGVKGSGEVETALSDVTRCWSGGGDRFSADVDDRDEGRNAVEMFKRMFDQNGGAECMERLKRTVDRKAAVGIAMGEESLGNGIEDALNSAKKMLNDAVEGIEGARRSKRQRVDEETAEAYELADNVIKEAKQQSEGRSVALSQNALEARLLDDYCRLLAVVGSKACGAIAACVESDGANAWSEQVKQMRRVSTRGVVQLGAITRTFTETASTQRALVDVANVGMRKLLQCVGLAVAVLQLEATARAHEFAHMTADSERMKGDEAR